MNIFTRKSIFAVFLILPLTFFTMTGCDDDDDDSKPTEQIVEKETKSYTPFKRVAELDGNWSKVSEVANTIAEYIHNTNEEEALGYPGNWVVAGVEEGSFDSHHILGIPMAVGDSVEKIKNIELCSKPYAEMALGTGHFHAPALPCQITVHSENNKIYIDMINPEAIFTLFFSDLSDEQKAGLGSVAEAVKNEIIGIIHTSLENASEEFNKNDKNLGAEFNSETEIASNPFLVWTYSDRTLDRDFTLEDADVIAKKIIEKLGNDEQPSTVEGLSEGSQWRAARENPLCAPNTKIIETCSPKYAMLAMSMGSQYASALPCEISVNVSETDSRNIEIVFLKPEFMFYNLFKDAFANMSSEQMQMFQTLPTTVLDDLQKIVESAIEELKTDAIYDLSRGGITDK